MPEDWAPIRGIRVQFQFRANDADDDDAEASTTARVVPADEDDEDDYDPNLIAEIVGHIVYTDEQEDGDEIAFVWAGEEVPAVEIQAVLENNSWTRLDEDEARGILELVDEASPAAATQEIMLVIGDPSSLDVDGMPNFETWTRVVTPADPALPLFGQRLLIDVTSPDDIYMYDDDEDDDEDEETEDVAADDGADSTIQAGKNAPAEQLDVWKVGSNIDGLPAVISYVTIVEPGVAQIAFWVSSLGDIDGFDLVAAGWETITPADLDTEEEFFLGDRVRLALRTRLDIREDEDGYPYLNDFEIDDAGTVPESMYELLPVGLATHCRFAAELNETDDIVSRWMTDESGKETPPAN